jgi:dTDP-4-amino-4,6-dideoxygalactose transaminase
MNKKIYVTQPYLPKLDELIPDLKKIWKSRQLTNGGRFLTQLESAMTEFLGVPHVCLFTNGTIALITAIRALGLTGEVITTPYSFVATTHALSWCGITPVFVDIDPVTGNMSEQRIEKAITRKTSGILPVHVYGNPCATEKIQSIAAANKLSLIYDAAHAFAVKKNGTSILLAGDLSVLSFHATKCFNTFEGGAIVCHDKTIKTRINRLKNFGFIDEVTLAGIGINGKMNEFQAVVGIKQLEHFTENLFKRKKLFELYRQELESIKGIRLIQPPRGTESNYSYAPIVVTKTVYGLSRDALYARLKDAGIFCRRYFYPLIANLDAYKSLPTAEPRNLPDANKLSSSVLCLPLFSELKRSDLKRIVSLIKKS